MKTSKDPRHKNRQELVKALFAESFTPQQSQNKTVKQILELLPEIDTKIAEIAPDFPTDKINKVDLAILRLGTYELIYDKSQPQKVVIDEAIELAKEFGNQTSASFINGALGKLAREEK